MPETMPSGTATGNGASLTGLVTGILSDAQDLMKQQVALLRTEIREDFRKTKEAGLTMIGGAICAAVGGLLLCLMVVYLLHWATELPLWGCFAIVGGLLSLVGAALIWAGKAKFETFNPLPDQSAEALKENVQWMTNPK